VFAPEQTVFQDALNAGYSTAVAGWYNPYCRILPNVLDRCFWTSHLPGRGSLYADRTLMGNMLNPFRGYLTAAWRGLLQSPGRSDMDAQRSKMHIFDYDALVRKGDELLSNSSFRSVFLHLPIPHPAASSIAGQ
jgi:hypothetical protein